MVKKSVAWDARPYVVDPRLSAGRGVEFSVGGALHEENEDKDEGVEERAEAVCDEPASIHTPISEKNVGFQLLQKMGWKGTGLGRNEDGIVAPVKPYQDGGENTRMGLGKMEQDEEYTNAENVSRRKLEVEIQADEDEERCRRREVQVIREQKIKEDVQAAMQKFYCQICHKQYQTIMEWETHLSSYDHHHKKRLAEMKQMVSGRSKQNRLRREQKQLSKEMAHLAEQSERAKELEKRDPASVSKPEVQAAQPRSELPTERSTIQFGFGSSTSMTGGKVSITGSNVNQKRGPPPILMKSRAKSQKVEKKSNLDAFGSDSD